MALQGMCRSISSEYIRDFSHSVIIQIHCNRIIIDLEQFLRMQFLFSASASAPPRSVSALLSAAKKSNINAKMYCIACFIL